MTEDQRNLILRYVAAISPQFPYGKTPGTEAKDRPESVLKEFDETFGFNPVDHPEKVGGILEDAMLSRNPDDVDCALYMAGFVGLPASLIPFLIRILEQPWHRSHEYIASLFQDLKAPETVDVLYRTALTGNQFQPWDDSYVLARRCTWALADIGTPEAYSRLQLLSKYEIREIARFARKRIDNWQQEISRKGT